MRIRPEETTHDVVGGVQEGWSGVQQHVDTDGKSLLQTSLASVFEQAEFPGASHPKPDAGFVHWLPVRQLGGVGGLQQHLHV